MVTSYRQRLLALEHGPVTPDLGKDQDQQAGQDHLNPK